MSPPEMVGLVPQLVNAGAVPEAETRGVVTLPANVQEGVDVFVLVQSSVAVLELP
jgi:hypothetical protein